MSLCKKITRSITGLLFILVIPMASLAASACKEPVSKQKCSDTWKSSSAYESYKYSVQPTTIELGNHNGSEMCKIIYFSPLVRSGQDTDGGRVHTNQTGYFCPSQPMVVNEFGYLVMQAQ
jgi:hypothetical protein